MRLIGVCLRQGRTGSDGRVVFDEVPAGEWSARAGERSRWMGEVWNLRDLETRSLRLVLGEGTIRGRVSRGPDGAGVSGIAVSASGPARDMTRTGPDGSFSFEHAAPGLYTIQAVLEEGDTRTVEAQVPAAGDAPPVEIRLEP